MTPVAAILSQQLHVIPLLLGSGRVNLVQTGNRNTALSQAGLDQSLQKPRVWVQSVARKRRLGVKARGSQTTLPIRPPCRKTGSLQHRGVEELRFSQAHAPLRCPVVCNCCTLLWCGTFWLQKGKNLIATARTQEGLSPKVNLTAQILPSSKVCFRRIEAESKNLILELLSVSLAAVRQSGSPPRWTGIQRALDELPYEQAKGCRSKTPSRPPAFAWTGKLARIIPLLIQV